MSQRLLVGAVIAACSALLFTGCTTTLQGKAVSVFDDPFHVAGMAASDGPTGLRTTLQIFVASAGDYYPLRSDIPQRAQ